MNSRDPLLHERASRIRLLALDVDGVLTDGRLYFDNQGNEHKAFNTRDGLGLRVLQGCGISIALITGRESGIVARRAAQLGIEHVYQGQVDKLTAYMDLLEKTGLQDEQICYAGDDWNDLPVLQRVGLAVTVPAADLAVRERVHWITTLGGGEGAVREICQLLLDAQGHAEGVLREILGS